MKKYSLSFIYTIIFALLVIRCGESADYPSIGQNIASPLNVEAINDTHFVVLNSDYDQTYNEGSLLTLDKTGNKVSALATHRLGMDMKILGNQLLVLFASPEGDKGIAEIFDVTDPTAIKSLKSFEIDCAPLGLALGTNYAAVSCSEGKIFVADISNLASSSFKLIRDYGFPRRALYINDTHGTLLAFPATDISTFVPQDKRFDDQKTYTDTTSTNTPNGIPDILEDSKEDRLEVEGYQLYQVAVVDLDKAKADNFPEPSSDINTLKGELFWLDYKLTDENSAVDHATDSDQNSKIFRTNFWSIKNDPFNTADTFFASQRISGTQDATILSNNLLSISIIADPASATGLNASEFLSYKRLYGSSADNPEKPFPSQFTANTVNGSQVLLVNHFRDIANFKSDDTYTLTSKEISTVHAPFELIGSAPENAYYDLALTTDGTVLSTSFFGSNVVLLSLPSDLNVSGATPQVIR